MSERSSDRRLSRATVEIHLLHDLQLLLELALQGLLLPDLLGQVENHPLDFLLTERQVSQKDVCLGYNF